MIHQSHHINTGSTVACISQLVELPIDEIECGDAFCRYGESLLLPNVSRAQKCMYVSWQDVWNKTYYPKADDHKNVEKKWYIVDAADKRLGRLASTIAIHIRGKNVPSFTPSTDMGAYVVVVRH